MPATDISTFNEEQHRAYDTLVRHQVQIIANQKPNPLFMLVCGTAGTGKLYLISTIAHVLGDACLLTSTTDMASFNTCGRALHSALKLPIHHSNKQDLQGNSLQRLQLIVKNVQYLVIDEMSMIGQRILAWVDKRLQKVTGQLNQLMGGLSVILFGDFGQLPPVGDRPLYAQPSTSELSVHGHPMHLMFTTVVVLSQVLLQAGNDPAGEEPPNAFARWQCLQR